jgi:hypothetical protein
MKKLLLFLLAFFCLPMQAMNFRVYNAHPTRTIKIVDPQSDTFTVEPRTLSAVHRFKYILLNYLDGDEWRYSVNEPFAPGKWFNVSFARGTENPVIVIEPLTGSSDQLNYAYAIPYTEWQKRFDAQQANPIEQKEQKAKEEGAAIPNFIPIHLPDGTLAQLNTLDEDVFESETFKKLIADQFAKNDSFILARVLNEEGQAYYFDAHTFNKSLFKQFDLRTVPVDLPPEAGSQIGMSTVQVFGVDAVTEDIYLRHGESVDYPIIFQKLTGLYNRDNGQYNYLSYYKLPDNKKVNTAIGVQYFVLEPNKIAAGFQYLCSYTAARGFHNDVANSPYKGLSQDNFLNIFYANQNVDTPVLKALKKRAQEIVEPIYKKIKTEIEARERKAAEEKKAEEEKKKKAEPAGTTATIYLPDGKTEQLDLSENDPYGVLTSFKELIDDQKEKGDPFILARVVAGARPYYFDAHEFNQAFFSDRRVFVYGVENQFFKRNRRSMMPGTDDDYFNRYETPDKQKINTNIGVQYFIYDPKKPQEGFQYFATYAKNKSFHNDKAGSPYKGRSYDYFIDEFYANQNRAEYEPDRAESVRLKKLKADAKVDLATKYPPLAPSTGAEQKGQEEKKAGAAAQDLVGLSNDEVARRYRIARETHKNYREAARLLEELYRRADARNDVLIQRTYAILLGDLYFNGGFGLTPNYEKAKTYYTYARDNALSDTFRNSMQERLQQVEQKLAASRAGEGKAQEEKKGAAQDGYEKLLQEAKALYEAGDQIRNYSDALDKLRVVYQYASDVLRYEAACLMGEIYFKGGRLVTANNAKAAEYLEMVHGGPCLERAQELLTQIAMAESLRTATQPQQPRPGPGSETKRNIAAEEEAQRLAEAARLAGEDPELAAAIAASLKPQEAKEREAEQKEQKAGARLPENPVYPTTETEAAAEQRRTDAHLMQLGREAYNAGRWQEATQALEGLYNRLPPTAYIPTQFTVTKIKVAELLGNIYHHLGEWAKARRYYTELRSSTESGDRLLAETRLREIEAKLAAAASAERKVATADVGADLQLLHGALLGLSSAIR